MKILILNGVGRCGKDTFVDILEQKLKKQGKILFRYSTIDEIKTIAMESFQWDGIKDDKGRKLLSDLKIASIEYNNLPHNHMVENIKYAESINCDVFTCMIRDIPEIEKAVQDKRINKDLITILIQSDRVKKKYGNVGDDNVENYIYDYYIDNSGTLNDLEYHVDLFINDVFPKEEKAASNTKNIEKRMHVLKQFFNKKIQ